MYTGYNSDDTEYKYRVVRKSEARTLVNSIEFATEREAFLYLIRFLKYSHTPDDSKKEMIIQRRQKTPQWETLSDA